MKRVWLISLVIAGLLLTIQNAAAMGVTTLELDREITLQAPDIPMDKATAPKLLYARYNYSWEPYVKVYRFRVVPGQKYTFYMIHPADGDKMNAYLRGDNPLSDYTASYGPSGYLRGFVSWGQDPGRDTSCEFRARRFNFTISPKSEHPWLYLVATYAKPNTAFKVLLKSQADSDQEVESSRQDAYCPARKGYSWGSVWKREFLLTLIPGEKAEEVMAPEKVAAPVSEDGQTPLIPLDREVTLQAPDVPMNKETAPKLLYARYNYSWEPYVKVYRFKVVPGQRYTFYMIHPADGDSMNAYLRGDNPMSDYTYSYGPSGYLTGFVSFGQQPGKDTSCKERARRFNFTISPKSEHPWLYLIATYAKPNTAFRVLLKSQADSDEEVQSSRQDAYCPARKGYSWGSVWKREFLLTLIPGEKHVQTEPVSRSGGEAATPTPPPERHEDIRTVNGWITYMRSGRPFNVVFDATGGKFDDSTYTGDLGTDPMGTLKGGETYRLAYANGKFECTGFNQGTGSVGTWAYIGDPEEGLMSLWGRLFNFDGKGRVWDQDFGIVGHMRPVE